LPKEEEKEVLALKTLLWVLNQAVTERTLLTQLYLH